MVAAATLFIAVLAASSQAIASHNSHNSHHGRSLHDASHHHIAVARDYVSPNVASPLAKRHEANKKRTDTKRARRCKPKPKTPAADPTSTKKPAPTQNTPVKDKDDPTPPPKSPPKADPPKADPPKKSGGGGGDTYTGDGTFYATGLNACGTVDKDSDFIAAASHAFFDGFPGATANPNNNPICNRRLRATYQGNSVVVKITDRCGGCDIYGSLDFSPSAFKVLADPNVGRIHGVTWEFI